MLRQVQLYGAHAETFQLNVENVAEAVRAILTLRPELQQHIQQNNWQVIVGPLETGYALDASELHGNAGRQPIHFLPEIILAGGNMRAIGKIIIGAVLIAAAVFLAPVVFPAAGALAAGTLGGIVQSAVLGMGVSMVLGGTAMLLSPTPRAPTATDQASPEERPSFFFNGPVNISEQGAPIPLVYGYHRVGSIVVNAGAWNEDIAAEEVEAEALALQQQRSLPAPAESVLYPSIPELLLAKGGGKGSSTGAAYVPREAPNNLRSRTLVRIHEVLCEGSIKGPRTMPNWGQSVYFDDTPLQSSDGQYNFDVSAAYLRKGVPTDGPIPGFPASEVTISVSTEVRYEEPVIRRVTSLDTTFIRLNIRVPQLMYQATNGDLVGSQVGIEIHYQVEGQPWKLVIHNTIQGKTTTGYERTYSFWLPPRDGSEIDLRVTRLNINAEDNTPGVTRNDTIWTSFTEVIDGVMLHNTEAAFAMTVDAEQFPSIPKRAYEFDWLIVQIPNNYNPVTRVYTGDWDGTFKWDWTNNPAWVLYDMLTHPIRGLGRDLSASTVDKWSFYAAAQYNDGQVSDVNDGLEPRFTFNGILNTQQEAITVCQAVASTFRAQFYVAGGTLYLAQDRPPAGYVRVFSPANTQGFDYQSTELRTRATVVNVAWVDPDAGWLPQVEPVTYGEMLGRYGYREGAITAYGCTSKGQAIRAGRYFLWGAHHEQEVVSFVTGLENADLRPGDVVVIQDPSRAAIEWSGRVVAVAGDIVTLDRPYQMASSMYFSVLDPETFTTDVFSAGIVSRPSPLQVQIDSNYTRVKPDAIWAMQAVSTRLTTWRVLSVAEQEEFKFHITAAFHDPNKYAYIDAGIKKSPLDYSALPSGALKPPTSLVAQDFYWIDPSGAPQAGIVWSWTPSADSRVIQYVGDAQGPNNEAPLHWSSIPGTTISVPTAETGNWRFTVKGADAVGRRSKSVTINYNTATSARIPLPPLNFMAQQTQGNSAELSWDMPDDLSIAFWWLKWTPEIANPKWDAAVTVLSTIPRNTLSIVLTAQTGTFLLKSVSVRGKQCTTAAIALLSMSDLRPYGAFHVEQPTWPGTKTNFYVDLEELVLEGLDDVPLGYLSPALTNTLPRDVTVEALADALTTGEYITPVLSLTQAAEVLSKVLLYARGVVPLDLMVNWVPLASAVPLSRTTSEDWTVVIEERSSLDNVTWTDWRPAQSGTFTARYVQYRLTAASYTPAVDIRVGRMEEWLMLPEYDQAGESTTNASGVVQVNLDPAYYAVPEIHIQPAMTTTAILSLTNVDPDHFNVQSTTPPGAVAPSVAFRWVCYGYGRLP